MNDFCLAPWTHTYISPQGERRLCCASREPAQNFKQYIDTAAGTGEFNPLTLDQYWNSERVRNVRSKWLRGEVPDECVVCDKKLLNTSVYRDYFNHLFGDLRQQAIDTTDEQGYTTMRPVSFDYRYSNVCNFKCRMCGDMLSSAWEAEVQRHDMWNKNDPKNHWMLPANRHAIRQFVNNTVIPEFREAIENKTVREIYWVGGEPLLYDEHWTFMRRIVELGYADRVKVRYNTNLSYIRDKHGDLWDLLDNFQHWEICASLDSTGDLGAYIRTGLDYDSWLGNLEMALNRQQHKRQVRVDFTLTLPGMVGIAGIVELCERLDVPLLSKVVFAFSPDLLLSPLALPKQVLHDWIDSILASVEFGNNTRSLREVLEHLKTRPTFEEEYPDRYQEAAAQGKRHLLKLESLRPDAKLSMEQILASHQPALDWWRRIDE